MDKPEKPDFRVIEYPFHLGDLVGGTTNLDDAQFGAYMRILLANINKQAKNGGLPDNLEVIRSYTRMGPAKFKKLWLLIGDKFVQEDGKIFHERVKKTVNEIINLSNTNRANRLKGWETEQTGVEQSNDQRKSNPLTQKPINPTTKDKNTDSSDNSRAGKKEGQGFSNSEKNGARHSPRGGAFNIEHHLDDSDRDAARLICKGAKPHALDFYAMASEYNAWINKKGVFPDYPKAAFMAWLKKKANPEK